MSNHRRVDSRVLGTVLVGLAFVGLFSCSTAGPKAADARAAESSPRQRTLLDADWAIQLGDVTPNSQAVAPSYDDARWHRVDLPHDYLLDGTYSSTNDRGHGYLPFTAEESPTERDLNRDDL